MPDESRELTDYLRLSLQVDRSRALLKQDALVEPALAEMARRLRRDAPEVPEYSDVELDRYVAGDFTDSETRRLRYLAAHSEELLDRIAAAEARAHELEAAGPVSPPVLRLIRPAAEVLAPRPLRLAAQDAAPTNSAPVVRTCTEAVGRYQLTFIEDDMARSCEVVLVLDDAPVAGAEVSIAIDGGGLVAVVTDESGCGRFDLPLDALLALLGDAERMIEVVPPPG